MFASLAGSTDQALRELVFTVLTDGLRPPPISGPINLTN